MILEATSLVTEPLPQAIKDDNGTTAEILILEMSKGVRIGKEQESLIIEMVILIKERIVIAQSMKQQPVWRTVAQKKAVSVANAGSGSRWIPPETGGLTKAVDLSGSDPYSPGGGWNSTFARNTLAESASISIDPNRRPERQYVFEQHAPEPTSGIIKTKSIVFL